MHSTKPSCLASPILLVALSLSLVLAQPASAQVHYNDAGNPWKQQARGGPDAEVDGWYYNLGITGMRAQLVADQPNYLLIKHVFKATPASGKIKVGDLVIGANGAKFETPHKNGYGMDIFGPDGPILDFATALEASQGKDLKGLLTLDILRGDKPLQVELKVGQKYGTFSPSYPLDCKKTDLIRHDLYEYLAETQRPDGSWGSPPQDTFAPLALLASGEHKYLRLVKKNAEWHARTTSAKDNSSLINWRYMAAAIVMSEYYLATKESWVPKELQQVYDFLISSQYVRMSQINERSRQSHPGSVPKDEKGANGGWGHNPGFEGYGPICMLTGQGALSFALMKHCGIEVDRERHDKAYEFLVRASGSNGYVWYADQAAGNDNWADMGRTGAAGMANALSPYEGGQYLERALAHAKVIGLHPESFPDTHGSPVMGMAYAAMAAHFDPASFRRLMDKNKWWFVLSQCPDGSFYYQPNRDNAGYGADSRVCASAVTAFILSLDKKNLHLSGKK
ncbi:MAG: DUF6288 domain-containing protein [Akkermansiaceae bacterium]|nr:DUF6288 domain-containing protein [Akkermansiaceae bacterium]MCF7731252.1 DUF6288 domain-containing protein [Akkermansiaceae bacterium]